MSAVAAGRGVLRSAEGLAGQQLCMSCSLAAGKSGVTRGERGSRCASGAPGQLGLH